MEHTKEFRETYNKILVEHYGDISSWETDHWKHFKALADLVVKEEEYKNDLIGAERIKYDLNVTERIRNYLNVDLVAYTKDIQSSLSDANNLLVAADKLEHLKGPLEPDNKAFIVKKHTDDGLKLLQEALNLEDEREKLYQDELVNLGTFIPQKPVGRPSSFKFQYHWLDYLVLELGSKNKAVNYATDFPMWRSIKPASLLREYAKYCEAKGGG